MIILIGIFGNHPFDRHHEQELNKYLESLDKCTCEKCGHEGHWENFIMNEEEYTDQGDPLNHKCPECNYKWYE